MKNRNRLGFLLTRHDVSMFTISTWLHVYRSISQCLLEQPQIQERPEHAGVSRKCGKNVESETTDQSVGFHSVGACRSRRFGNLIRGVCWEVKREEKQKSEKSQMSFDERGEMGGSLSGKLAPWKRSPGFWWGFKFLKLEQAI